MAKTEEAQTQDQEAPENAEIVVKTDEHSAEECAEQIVDWLEGKGYLSAD